MELDPSDKDGVLKVLAPIRPQLTWIPTSAFHDYFTLYQNVLPLHGPEIQSPLITNLMQVKAREAFGNQQKKGIHVFDLENRFFVNYRDRVAICFKKIGDGLKIASNLTAQNIAFEAQDQMSLFPAAVHLFVGYTEGKTRFELGDVWTICPAGVGKAHLWTQLLSGTGGSGIPQPISLPLDINGPTERRVRPKILPGKQNPAA